MQRSVVVFPQPDGPSSVKSSPSRTSSEMSSTAWTRPILSPRPDANVFTRLVTVSMTTLRLPDADLGAELVCDGDEHDERADHHDSERGELRELSVAVLLPDRDREHLATRRVQEHRAAELAYGDDHDVDPAGDEPGSEQRQHDPPEHLEPTRAAHQRRLLELAPDLDHRRRRVAHAVRDVA